MKFFALACDYDGTLAHDGAVDAETIEALDRVRQSGRKLVLVTGRELPDLREVFDRLDLFDAVVAENGAVLHLPRTKESKALAPPLPAALVPALQKRKVSPLSMGEVIVATREPNDAAVLEVIRELGLELQIIFNKGAVMILPTGVNKKTGLEAALTEIGLSLHNVAGIGDAENDQAFLMACEFSAATANALPSIKDSADWVTSRPRGEGVRELIEHLLKDDLHKLDARTGRRHIKVGTDSRGNSIEVPGYGPSLLLAGGSGAGKSTLAKVFIEGLCDAGYQYCVVDPEGDYEGFEDAVVLGDRKRVPSVEEVMQLLGDASQKAAVNLLGVPLLERPAYFVTLLTRLQAMRADTGRPHWLILDEAHHLLPHRQGTPTLALPHGLANTVFITVDPAEVRPEALAGTDIVMVVGEEAQDKIEAFARAVGEKAPSVPSVPLKVGEALMWVRGRRVRRFRVAPTRFQHRRHRRKYAEGDVGRELSFYFRGPENRLNLRCQNLIIFVQVAEGVDDETWQYHLERGDLSRWFAEVIKDDELAEEARAIESGRMLPPDKSREAIRAAIEKRYTLPSASTRTEWDQES
jgi:hydroxymethylpyrimidine pyrophosphatase-like HAD family hydrolase